MKYSRVLALASLIFGVSIALCTSVSAYGQTLSVWQTDVCDKIFSDTPAGDEKPIRFQAASNEYESALIGLRSDTELKDVKIEVSALKGVEQGAVIQQAHITVREVGVLPLEHNTPGAENIVTRKAPCDMPDILYDRSTVSLKPGVSQGIWITLFIPKGTPGGAYAGTLTLTADSFSKEIPVEAQIFPFELPDTRHFYATNWWSPENFARLHQVEFLSEEYWSILEQYLKNMGEHRQNVSRVFWVPGNFVKATLNEDGTLTFDFANFDRLLDLGLKYGVLDRIELSHVGGINREDHSVRMLSATVYDGSKKASLSVGADVWLEPTLKAVCNRLRERNLFDRAVVHIADEPFIFDMKAWRDVSARVRAIEPDLKQIDAIESINFDDYLDVWVPKLSHFDRWRSAYEKRRDKGEFWYYICCHPFGEVYPNRFMDLPGVRVRVLHWLNYSEDLVGYLHWGYNYWGEDPFGAPTTQYGPGDTHVVYPGDGKPLDSIRWEIERESAEDFEYLKLLEDKIAEVKAGYDLEKAWFIEPKSRSMELARRVVPSLASSTLDYNVVNQARLDVVNELNNVMGPVRLVVQTYPEDGATVYVGPTVFEIYGVATPGAEVTINGRELNVDEEGFFSDLQFFSEGEHELEIIATLDGKVAKTTRRFIVSSRL